MTVAQCYWNPGPPAAVGGSRNKWRLCSVTGLRCWEAQPFSNKCYSPGAQDVRNPWPLRLSSSLGLFQPSEPSLMVNSSQPCCLCCLCSLFFFPICSLELFSCPLAAITAAPSFPTTTAIALLPPLHFHFHFHCPVLVLAAQTALLMMKSKSRQDCERDGEEKP